MFCGCIKNKEGKIETAKFKKAPEPQDINFEHLDVSRFTRGRRTLLTFSISFLMIGVCFGAIYGLNIYSDSLDSESTASSALSALISVIISVVNIILKYIVRALSKYEENETMTK